MTASTSGRRLDPAQITIRDVEDGDLPAVQAIYAGHVLNGLASFEETPPDLAEMRRRYAAIRSGGYPYRAAILGGALKGYAYAAAYRARPAYRNTVEDSIYVAPEAVGRGIGRLLLADLIDRCTERDFRQIVAIIGDSANRPSIDLHAKLGFRNIGTLQSCGFKFGRWVDSVIMQRDLGAGDRTLPSRP
ncbi:MAG: N-acetyltransferase family protein [Rhodospirillales bacterium]|nr:N-acetyltransferase family protein [Rhodospirillales bacterium]